MTDVNNPQFFTACWIKRGYKHVNMSVSTQPGQYKCFSLLPYIYIYTHTCMYKSMCTCNTKKMIIHGHVCHYIALTHTHTIEQSKPYLKASGRQLGRVVVYGFWARCRWIAERIIHTYTKKWPHSMTCEIRLKALWKMT